MSAALVMLKILGVYSLLTIFFSVVGNMITIIVCSKNKENTAFILLQYLSGNNLIAVSFWSLSHFIDSQFSIDFQSYSMFIYKFGNWIQFSGLQASAWLLVSISLERYLSFQNKLCKEKYFKTKIVHIFAALICFVIYAINLNFLIFLNFLEMYISFNFKQSLKTK